jgi:hypothetical protein
MGYLKKDELPPVVAIACRALDDAGLDQICG